jgi:hypothetical protein
MPGAGEVTRLLCAAAAVVLATTLEIGNGRFNPFSITLATIAFALTLAAALRWRAAPAEAARAGQLERATQATLGVGCGLGPALLFFVEPAAELGTGARAPLFALAACALGLLATYRRALPGTLLARWRFPALLAVAAALGLLVLHYSPAPRIDVFVFQRDGAALLLKQLNPYLGSYPNLYPDHPEYYSPALLEGGRLAVNPYPPLTLLLGVPGYLLGDVRLASLLALLGAAAAIAALGRRAGASPAIAELAGLLVVFQPRALFVLEQAWTETVALALLALALLAIQGFLAAPGRGALLACGLALGAAAAAKQYMPLLLLPIWLALPRCRGAREKTALVAFGVVAATVVPFALSAPAAFYRSVVMMQVLQPLRLDALSFLALWGQFFPLPPQAAVLGFIAAPALLLAARPRGTDRSVLAQATLAAASAFFAFVLFNKQAFCNYLFLVVGTLTAAAVLLSAKGQDGARGRAAGPEI